MHLQAHSIGRSIASRLIAKLTVLMAPVVSLADGGGTGRGFDIVSVEPASAWHRPKHGPQDTAAQAAPDLMDNTKFLEVTAQAAVERAEINARRRERTAGHSGADDAKTDVPDEIGPPAPAVRVYLVPAEDPFTYHPAIRRTYVTPPPKFYQPEAPKYYEPSPPRLYRPVPVRQYEPRYRDRWVPVYVTLAEEVQDRSAPPNTAP